MRGFVKLAFAPILSTSLALAGCMASPDDEDMTEAEAVASLQAAQTQVQAPDMPAAQLPGQLPVEAPKAPLPPLAAVPSGPTACPTYQAPGYGAPSCAAPTIPAPTYGAPQYTAPVHQAPTYHAPTYQQPAESPVFSAPTYTAPSYAGPTFQAPVYQAPVYMAPNYPAPIYLAPTYVAPQAMLPANVTPQGAINVEIPLAPKAPGQVINP